MPVINIKRRMLVIKLTNSEMNIFLYIIIFICGTLFGSFYTLAVYRIPKGIDIVKKHSYCPNCNHKLGILDLIPILSYIFLGGKCRYCKQKIRARYLILEILSGIAFVIFAYVLKIDAYKFEINKIILLAFMVLYFTAIVLISAIDKEYRNINKKLLAYAVIISLLYMIYLYIIERSSIYRYAIYLAIYIALLGIDTFILRRYAKNNYYIDLLLYFMIIIVFMEYPISIITLMIFIVLILIDIITRKIKQKKWHESIKIEKIPFGFYLGASNIIIILYMCLVNICVI